jgi:hypothetical protein
LELVEQVQQLSQQYRQLMEWHQYFQRFLRPAAAAAVLITAQVALADLAAAEVAICRAEQVTIQPLHLLRETLAERPHKAQITHHAGAAELRPLVEMELQVTAEMVEMEQHRALPDHL